jgi:hypothetical protein
MAVVGIYSSSRGMQGFLQELVLARASASPELSSTAGSVSCVM